MLMKPGAGYSEAGRVDLGPAAEVREIADGCYRVSVDRDVGHDSGVAAPVVDGAVAEDQVVVG
jgi:hypothetical protein